MTEKKSNGANQKKKIIRIATRLMSEKGYKGTSLQEIADRVGIHKSTLFHYFKNKEELLLAVLRVAIQEVTTNLQKIFEDESLSPEEKLGHAIYNHLDLLVKYIDNVTVYHNEIRFLSRGHKLQYLDSRRDYASYFEQIIDRIKAGGPGYFKGLDTKIVVYGILGMCNWVVKWYRKSGPYRTNDIAEIFVRMLIPKGGHEACTLRLPKSKKP